MQESSIHRIAYILREKMENVVCLCGRLRIQRRDVEPFSGMRAVVVP